MPFKLINYLDSIGSSKDNQIDIKPNYYYHSTSNFENVDQKHRGLKCKAFGIVYNVE